jgi:hypothetical protein
MSEPTPRERIRAEADDALVRAVAALTAQGA